MLLKFKPKNAYNFVQKFPLYYNKQNPKRFELYRPIIREQIIYTKIA